MNLKKLFSFDPERDDSRRGELRELPVFNCLSEKERSRLEHLIFFRRYRKGEFLFKQNTPGHALFVLIKGKVDLEREMSDGSTSVVGSLSDGSFLGELALLASGERSFSVRAVTETSCAVFFKHDFEKFIDKYPGSGVKILLEISKMLAGRLMDTLCDPNAVNGPLQ